MPARREEMRKTLRVPRNMDNETVTFLLKYVPLHSRSSVWAMIRESESIKRDNAFTKLSFSDTETRLRTKPRLAASIT